MGGGIASVGPTPKKVLAVHPVFNSVGGSLLLQPDHYPNLLVGCLYSGSSSLGLGGFREAVSKELYVIIQFDDPLPKHEGFAVIENTVSMSSGDSLQD